MVGRTFTGVTHNGRVLTLVKVLDYEAWREQAQYKCKWFDENGKHYEYFNLADTSAEFKEFQFIS